MKNFKENKSVKNYSESKEVNGNLDYFRILKRE